MYKFLYRAKALFILLISFLTVNAQFGIYESLNKKIGLYGKAKQSPVLFIHFDKTVYTNNETVWFTGYLMNVEHFDLYTTLSVNLIRDDDRSIATQNIFEIRNGLCPGSLVIPNSIPPGNYSISAVTNRLANGRPEVLFIQPITIKTQEERKFTATLKLSDEQSKDDVIIDLSLQRRSQSSSDTSLKNIELSYSLGESSNPIVSGLGKTSTGSYRFSIPRKFVGPSTGMFRVSIWGKSGREEISIAIPNIKKPIQVHFYPESGNMVNGMINRIGWTATLPDGKATTANALLYEGDRLLETISTDEDGMGVFSMNPKPGISYHIKLKNDGQDTIYHLPSALPEGVLISLTNSIVGDTLTANIQSTVKQKLILVGHNFKQTFFMVPIEPGTGDKRLKILLKEVPKGLTALTVADTLGRALAERLFFAHFDHRHKIDIKTDKKEYKKREKVTVQIRLAETLRDSGLVSIACVQANRLEQIKKNDIESFVYLKNELNNIPIRSSYFEHTDADIKFLEKVMLIKGWRKYRWAEAMDPVHRDADQKLSSVVFSGRVKKSGKSLNSPVSLITLGESQNLLSTDRNGKFIVPDSYLLSADTSRKITLMVQGPSPQSYSMKVYNPYLKLGYRIAEEMVPGNFSNGTTRDEDLRIPPDERAIRLDEVNITARKDNSFYNVSGLDSENRYRITTVDVSNTLKGTVKMQSVVTRVYETHGIPPSYKLQISGIYGQKEFYPLDFSKNTGDPEFATTLFWKHRAKISSDRDFEFSFYTSDISGKFKLVVQGLAISDVVQGEYSFEVKQ